MNRIAMPSESKYRDKSPSRIPHFKQTPIDVNKESTPAKRPSRLELLQVDYQKKLMKEKEEKLVQMYEENQRKALERVNRQNSSSSNRSTPSVREFFQERRKMESKGFYSPPIDQHYRQIRSDMSYPSSGDWSRKGSANSNASMYSKGSSAGRDRSCLLQPIAKSPGMAGSPTRQIKPRMIQPKQNITSSYRNNNAKVANPGYNSDNRNKDKQPEGSSSSDNSPPPNLANLRNYQRKRLNSQKSASDVEHGGQEKLTDFQKWQMEQNKAREERLKRHQQINGDADRWDREEEDGGEGDKENVDIDSDTVRRQDEQNKARVERLKRHQKVNADAVKWGNEEEEEDSGAEKVDINSEIAKKQQELLDQIERQERELEELKQERIQEEEQARKNAERERQRQTIEREKRRKKQEEKRRQEEEEEREEQRRQEEEEEQQRRIDEEESRMETQRLSQRRQQKPEVYHEEDEGGDTNRNSKYSAPKPKTKPIRQPPSPAKRSPSPEEQYNDRGANLDIYLQAAQDESAHEGPGSLVPCRLCGRKFAADRIAKHQSACTIAQKKRKVFDPVKMRTSGTEMSKYVNKSQKDTPKPKKNNWKTKHDSFIESIRYAKKLSQMEATGNFTNIGPPPKADTSDLVPCPHCGRKFNDSVAERHIPRCKNLKTKPVGGRR